jgi:hypothetical protein
MIKLQLTKAEALLAYELFKQNNEELLEQISQGLDEQMTREEMEKAARKNYVTNLENEVKSLRTKLDAKNMASASNVVQEAPWGLKKDGTPKKRPGRPVGF